MTIDDIDFSALYRSHLDLSGRTRKSPEKWDSRAGSMANKALRSPYSDAFVARMDLRGATSLLDIGCGPGTIALAVADQLERVVGLDYSQAMLDVMQANASREGLTNVQTIHRAWEDDWDDVPECDIVVASRSTTVEDIGAALAKLHAKARKRVYLTHIVGGYFTDPVISRAIGRRAASVPDYIYLINVLHAMGIHPRLDYITNESRLADARDYDDFAYRVAWAMGSLDPDEHERLRAWYDRATPAERKGTPMRWALVSWEKDGE